MSEKDVVEEKALEYEVMPGADRPEDDDSPQLDLSFDEVVAEIADDAEEPEEETVSEDEQSTEEETEEETEEKGAWAGTAVAIAAAVVGGGTDGEQRGTSPAMSSGSDVSVSNHPSLGRVYSSSVSPQML